jgi:hypothetical protein
MQQGEQVPLNALTSWDTLRQLITAFNGTHQERTPPMVIDPDLITLRDAFAHGRLGADSSSTYLVLMRFRKPGPGATTVTVEDRYELTIDFMNRQIARVGSALEIVTGRLRELHP